MTWRPEGPLRPLPGPAGQQVSRGDRSWHFLVLRRMDHVRRRCRAIERWIGVRAARSAPTMPDLGAGRRHLRSEHPDPARVAELYRCLGVAGAPTVCRGEELRYRAVLATPAGPKELT